MPRHERAVETSRVASVTRG